MVNFIVGDVTSTVQEYGQFSAVLTVILANVQWFGQFLIFKFCQLFTTNFSGLYQRFKFRRSSCLYTRPYPGNRRHYTKHIQALTDHWEYIFEKYFRWTWHKSSPMGGLMLQQPPEMQTFSATGSHGQLLASSGVSRFEDHWLIRLRRLRQELFI